MKSWHALQQTLYMSLKMEIEKHILQYPKSLQSYQHRFRKDQTQLEPSQLKEFIKNLNQAEIVLIGDFHTLRQSQRFVLRLLRNASIKKPDFLAFEILSSDHLPYLKDWLKHRNVKAEARLKDALKLESFWGSHWEAYRDLFLFCHKEGIRIDPLFHKEKRLSKRDRLFAKDLHHSTGRGWALLGEFHCARPHLPKLLWKLNPQRRILIVQQNDDQSTLKLFHRSSEKSTLVLKSPEWFPDRRKNAEAIDHYCVLHTPLWIKYKSQLEHILRFDDREDGEIIDPQDQIEWSIHTLQKFLNDPRYPTRSLQRYIENIHIYSPEDPHFYRSVGKLSQREKRILVQELKISGVSYRPSINSLFLSELTINACSQGAGLFLYALWSNNLSEPKTFEEVCVRETLSFFLSKLLNHSRKAPNWRHLPLKLTLKQRNEMRRLECFIRYKNYESIMTTRHLKMSALVIGRHIAEQLFEAFLAEEFSRSRLIRLLKIKIQKPQEALWILNELTSIARFFSREYSNVW